jgi:hypothetical protein
MEHFKGTSAEETFQIFSCRSSYFRSVDTVTFCYRPLEPGPISALTAAAVTPCNFSTRVRNACYAALLGGP